MVERHGGQAYGAAVLMFAFTHAGVQKRMCTRTGHDLYANCTHHKLASMETVGSVPEVKCVSLMEAVLLLLQDNDALKHIMVILKLPQL